MTSTATSRPKISFPPLAVARAKARAAGLVVSEQRSATMTTPAVFLAPAAPAKPDDKEADKLRAKIARLERDNAKIKAAKDAAEAAQAAAEHAAKQRAHREERVKAITLRVVDNRAAYAAKLPQRRAPLVALTSTRIITADVWEQPQAEA